MSEITVGDLYTKIGVQAVELDALRAQLRVQEQALEAMRAEHEPPAEENGTSGRARRELEEREAAERAKRS